MTQSLSQDPAASLYLLQYPERPRDQHYDMAACKVCRMKPNHRKLEMKLSTAGNPSNVREGEEEPDLCLQAYGAGMPPGVAFMAADSQAGALHLAGIGEVAQLRPDMERAEGLEEKARQGEGAASSRPGKQGPEQREPMPVQMRVRSREAERQEEKRLSSYSHLKEQEEREPWQDLLFHLPSSARAGALLSALRSAPSEAVEPLPLPTFWERLAPASTSPGQGNGP